MSVHGHIDSSILRTRPCGRAPGGQLAARWVAGWWLGGGLHAHANTAARFACHMQTSSNQSIDSNFDFWVAKPPRREAWVFWVVFMPSFFYASNSRECV